MSTLNDVKMKSLADKLVEVEKVKVELENAIDEVAGDKKVKISKKKIFKRK